MKSKNYLYLLLIGMVLTLGACSKDNNNNPDPDPGPGPEPLGKGYFSLNLSAGNASVISRGGATRATEVGTNNEQIVNEVMILLYKDTGTAANDNLAYGWLIDLTNDPDGNGSVLGDFETTGGRGDEMLLGTESYYPGSTEASFRTIAQEVDIQKYKLIVFANGGDFLDYLGFVDFSDNPYGIMTIDESAAFYNFHNMYGTCMRYDWGDMDFTQPLDPTYFYMDMGESESTNFFMSNANGPVPVLASDLKTTATEAQEHPVKVNIDRAVAKVMVNEKENGTPVYSGGTIADGDFMWYLKNVNTKEYLVRHYAPFAHVPATMEEHATSVIVSNREYIYATDPNYLQAEQHPDEYYHMDWQSDYKEWNKWNETQSKVVEQYWSYTTENTAELTVQAGNDWDKTMTYVAVHTYIRYDFLLTTAPDGSYFSYNEGTDSDPDWKVFNFKQAYNWILTDSWPSEMTKLRGLIGYCTYPQETYYVPGTSGFKFIDDGSNDPDIYDSGLLSISKLAGKYHYDDEGYPIVIPDNIETGAGDATVWFHYEGFNYYEIPIRHYLPGTGSRTSTYAHYGVVRNNVYKLTINSIDGPGIPSKGFISFDVTIQPWYIRESNNELENPRQ